MTVAFDDSARLMLADGSHVERLVCHPRLPLVAGLDSSRPAVHVWEFGPAGLHGLGIVGADAAPYPPQAWDRYGKEPALAWHPHEARLAVAGESGLQCWTREGVTGMAHVPAGAHYSDVAFSPDGRTLWASPASDGKPDAWQRSDAIDLGTVTLQHDRRWDTGVTEHPGGGLVVTLASDQGATLMLFATPSDSVPARMRILQKAIILDVDGYECPIFSADGRFLATRGNAYVHSLDVFEFPSLRKIGHVTLGDPYPGYPYPQEWLDEQATWSRHNIAFAKRPEILLLGTSSGSILEIDLDRGHTVEHSLSESPISALAVLSTGQAVVADRSGLITVMDAPATENQPADTAGARERVAEFLAATVQLPDDADLDNDLILTDGLRTWDADDLDEVTEADDTDPTWLRLKASINSRATDVKPWG